VIVTRITGMTPEGITGSYREEMPVAAAIIPSI
jgi:hypothetical protein